MAGLFLAFNVLLIFPGYIAGIIMLSRSYCKLDPEIFTPDLSRFTSNPRFLEIAPKVMKRRKILQDEIKRKKRRWCLHLLLYIVIGLPLELFQCLVDTVSFLRLMYEHKDGPSLECNYPHGKLLKKSIELPERYIKQERLEKIAQVARLISSKQNSPEQYVPVLVFI